MLKDNPVLKYRSTWLVIGYTMVAVVIFLSLTPDPVTPKVDLPHIDKFFHALAYFSMMGWFAQIYYLKPVRIYYALSFLVMGVMLEYIQGFEPTRQADIWDMAANTSGVFIALLFSQNIYFSGVLKRFEKWI